MTTQLFVRSPWPQLLLSKFLLATNTKNLRRFSNQDRKNADTNEDMLFFEVAPPYLFTNERKQSLCCWIVFVCDSESKYFETRIYRSSKQLWRHLFNHLRVVGRQRLYQDIINLFFLTNNSKRTLSIPQNTTVLQQRESLFLSFDYCTKSKTRRI